jgi:hypothetical protein
MRTTGNTPVDGEVRAVASGALANGKPVVVNADGTVSIIVETVDPTPELGSPTVYESANTQGSDTATFDSTNNKVIIAYRDTANSNFGTAVVGTVSGVSITFGTPVVFESSYVYEISATFDSNSNKVVIACSAAGTSNFGAAKVGTVSGTSISFGSSVIFLAAASSEYSANFDSANNKVVIAYRRTSNGYGTAVVGTVSGTSISFGSTVVFESASSKFVASTFDSTNNKVVISYSDLGNTNKGTAVVGTVSGTSISFGSPAIFEDAIVNSTSVTFDSNSNKVVVAYSDAGNSAFGTAAVGTVSGTSISFGTPVVFESANTVAPSATFDSSTNRVVISYRDTPNSNRGTLTVGTVSGTSISFITPVVFETGATTAKSDSAVFDSSANRVVIPYSDGNDGGFGKAVVVKSAEISTNLTAENYIGIAKGAASDTAVATVQTGCSINDAQSGLTAGQDYYVQTDGTLGLTPADPSVLAGTAVSATKLIVKG